MPDGEGEDGVGMGWGRAKRVDPRNIETILSENRYLHLSICTLYIYVSLYTY